MIRVRFAPSPTGHLHVGGVRTALFNWLYAKSQNGSFILRIEDTDTKRSTAEYEEQIYKSMKWCGLEWDEGPQKGGAYAPYRQMDRFEKGVYEQPLKQLLGKKAAYYAIYDKDDPKKEIGQSFDYPAEAVENGCSVTVKLKVPEGRTHFHDLLKGDMEFENANYDDFIIIKSDGNPLYNFVVVVDDHEMEISHVFRGEDHITNTPKQVMIYEALGWKVPEFMHIPLILGEDRSPLSKRHGGTSVEFFRKEGYMRDGLMNYLALLGWTVEGDIFDPFEKVDSFSTSKITGKSVIFDYKKLEWVNGKHLRGKPVAEVVRLWKDWLDYMKDESPYYTKMIGAVEENEPEFVEEVVRICREKINTFKQLNEFVEPFLFGIEGYDEELVKKFLSKDTTDVIIAKALHLFEELGDTEYDDENVEAAVRKLPELTDAGNKRIFQTLRGAVTGRLITPGLFETVAVLGKERTIERLKKTRREFNASEL
ncbi:MAG TPA: glutamate--tRNA ligase [Thermotogota bacterium]|nr:glutamate--tRNA ligase [Thermotogota bacterium]HPJ88790.1 glutamate--tRNA ligase [Thermotogota bacterium]HPR96293.1 glutamate--tRNA ligase [Thermotogota bacterium]